MSLGSVGINCPRLDGLNGRFERFVQSVDIGERPAYRKISVLLALRLHILVSGMHFRFWDEFAAIADLGYPASHR